MSEEIDASVWLAGLRREFPSWGVLHVPWSGLWLAVHGRCLTLRAQTPSELREQLLAAAVRS